VVSFWNCPKNPQTPIFLAFCPFQVGVAPPPRSELPPLPTLKLTHSTAWCWFRQFPPLEYWSGTALSFADFAPEPIVSFYPFFPPSHPFSTELSQCGESPPPVLLVHVVTLSRFVLCWSNTALLLVVSAYFDYCHPDRSRNDRAFPSQGCRQIGFFFLIVFFESRTRLNSR